MHRVSFSSPISSPEDTKKNTNDDNSPDHKYSMIDFEFHFVSNFQSYSSCELSPLPATVNTRIGKTQLLENYMLKRIYGDSSVRLFFYYWWNENFCANLPNYGNVRIQISVKTNDKKNSFVYGNDGVGNNFFFNYPGHVNSAFLPCLW